MDRFNIEFTDPWPEDGQKFPNLFGHCGVTWLISRLHAVLAAPTAVHRWPRYDKVTGLNGARVHWETASYLLGVLLGWNDIGLGLKRISEGRRPAVDSPHLDLLEQVWNDRGQLDLFALWAWEQNTRVRPQQAWWSGGGSKRSPEAYRDRTWFDEFQRRYPGYGIAYDHDPYHGGNNPLHLGNGLGAFAEAPRAQLLRSGPNDARAILLLDAASGWGTALDQINLPGIGERSWHVDVVARPLGWLGTFRRSRITGRWFAGKHSVHSLGFD